MLGTIKRCWETEDGKIVDITGLENLFVFPVMGGLVDDRIHEMVRMANVWKTPIVSAFNGIGIVVNPDDNEKEILRRWEEVDKRGSVKYPHD